MKKSFATFFCFFVLIGLSMFFKNILIKQKSPIHNHIGHILPSKFLSIASMEFKGIVSDYYFLKFLTHIGDQIGKKKLSKQKHAFYIYNTIDIITDLDPWFWDAYLIADMLLTWEFNEIKLANKLLLKAKKYRTNDYKVFYYLGFNYFYFLNDSKNAVRYIQEAAKMPNSPAYIGNLAKRLAKNL